MTDPHSDYLPTQAELDAIARERLEQRVAELTEQLACADQYIDKQKRHMKRLVPGIALQGMAEQLGNAKIDNARLRELLRVCRNRLHMFPQLCIEINAELAEGE